MKVYLVGGAVRDTLLGIPIKDSDFVVVGATAHEMLAQGFHQVGADFPVFLHPNTHQEYALARTERKTGHGHLGFSVHADPSITLEEDLLRRDLTINAMAIEVHGLFDSTPISCQVIDPYHGQQDLTNKVLRHVSPAFSEDPLRVLRTARFYARYHSQSFTIADETVHLMQQIANQGELSHLSRERLWAESSKALQEKHSFAYFDILYQLGILAKFLPDLASSLQDDACKQRTFTALHAAQDSTLNVKTALLLSSFLDCTDKLELLKRTAQALLIPRHIVNFAHLFLGNFDTLTHLPNVSADSLLALLESTKAHKAHKADCTIFQLLQATGYITPTQCTSSFIQDSILAYQSIGIQNIDSSLTGKAIGDELTRLRHAKLHQLVMDSNGTTPNQP